MKKKHHRPIIGLTCEVNKLKPYYSEFDLACDYRYVRAIIRAGGIPLLIPINPDRKTASTLLRYVDGIVLIGGADIPPTFYGEKTRKKVQPMYRGRTYFDIWLYQTALRKKIPVLAICYGMQLINVIYGGTLYQDIASELKGTHKHHSKRNPYHPVKIEPGSLCQKIFRRSSFLVHSEHHQAVKRLGHSLKITAYSDDGIPEALEGPPGTIAVQWHPERQPKDKIQQRLFRYFVKMSRKKNSLPV